MTTRFNLKSAIRFAMSSAVAWSLSLNLLRLGSGVILLPLLLTRLSGPDLGMYYVFARLIAITQILDFGCSFSFSRSVSFAMGGATELQTHGLSPEPSCQCPTPDGGCPCTGPDACEAGCIAPLDAGCEGLLEGACAATSPSFGCYCIFVGPGQAVGLCVD